jgi:hypothetical protein
MNARVTLADVTSNPAFHSFSYYLKLAWLNRLKLIPPFNGCARYSRSKMLTIQAEHIPYLGVYLVEESFEYIGDADHGEPRWYAITTLGFSYIVQNNEPDAAEDILDSAHWQLMRMFHDPRWQYFIGETANAPYKVESVPGGSHHREYGTLMNNTNATPYAEMRMELQFKHGFDFEPIISDVFNRFHMRTLADYPEEPGDQVITTDWIVEPPPIATTTTLSYDYQVPVDADAMPTDGQLVHPSDAAETMRIAHIDADAQDNSAYLLTLKPGDTITLAGLTWTIMGTHDEATCLAITVNKMKAGELRGVQSLAFTIFTPAP